MSIEDRRKSDDGFTPMEMLVVTGLIAGVAIPGIMHLLGNTEAKTAHIQIQTSENSLNYVELDMRGVPSDQKGSEALGKQPTGADYWSGPYTRNAKQLTDPWGHAFVHKINVDGKSDMLESLATDGREGGTGDDQHIVAEP